MKERHTVCGELSELMKYGGMEEESMAGLWESTKTYMSGVCRRSLGQAEVGEVG